MCSNRPTDSMNDLWHGLLWCTEISSCRVLKWSFLIKVDYDKNLKVNSQTLQQWASTIPVLMVLHRFGGSDMLVEDRQSWDSSAQVFHRYRIKTV
jgi:hypothetical protein